MATEIPIIQMRGVHKSYVMDGVSVHALRGIDLTVQAGEFLAIMGPSGSGKSTLMNVLGCLDVPDEGEYLFGSQDISRLSSDELALLRNRELGFVFQNYNLLARTSALENVETPLIYSGIGKKQRQQMAVAMLERMGLGDRLQHLSNQLSGGQQQRVAIARALVTHPSLLLADEPTGNMDTATSAEFLTLLETFNKDEDLTILLITHEPEVAARAQRSLTLRDGVLETSQ